MKALKDLTKIVKNSKKKKGELVGVETNLQVSTQQKQMFHITINALLFECTILEPIQTRLIFRHLERTKRSSILLMQLLPKSKRTRPSESTRTRSSKSANQATSAQNNWPSIS